MVFDPQIDLSDESLFGNEVAEDATEQEFNSYYYERSEASRFHGLADRLLIAKAYKGEGKSALLRRVTGKVKGFRENIVIERRGHQIAPAIQGDDFSEWVRGWKKIILDNIAYEVGNSIGFAWTDDAMSLVEEAERKGFKDKNLLTSILDRFGVQFSAGGFKLSLEKPGIGENKQVEKLLQRWSTRNVLMWVIVDDIDKNFENTPRHRLKIASFFDAIRDINIQIPQVYIRATIRPNVWTIIRREFESLSHIRQYLVDMPWNTNDIEQILYWRIRGYIQRRGLWGRVSSELRGDDAKRRRTLISYVIQDPVKWGESHKAPCNAIATLSKMRPRWAIELVKAGSMSAHSNSHKKILLEDIMSSMDIFGKNRIFDINAEFKSQCSEIENLIVMFRHAKEEYDTEEFLRLVAEKISKIKDLTITGILGEPSARDVANFLFEIGFIAGKKYQDGGYEHFTFSDRPFYFKSQTVEEDDLWWEIHPCYRQALEIRQSDGRQRTLAKQAGR